MQMSEDLQTKTMITYLSASLMRTSICAAVMLFGALALAQQIIVDPSAPGTSFLLSGSQTPQIDIAAPESGVSHNRYLGFNVTSDGLILNNSQAAGVSRIGGAVGANPNLLVSGPATVILNEVKGGAPSTLAGTTEVFGTAADVIIANPGGITCSGCRFLNSSSSTLSTGTPSINNGQVSLAVSSGRDSHRPGRVRDGTQRRSVRPACCDQRPGFHGESDDRQHACGIGRFTECKFALWNGFCGTGYDGGAVAVCDRCERDGCDARRQHHDRGQ